MSASSCVWIGSFFSVWPMIESDLVLLGEEDLDAIDVLLLRHRDDARRQLLVGLENDFAGRRIDDVGRGERALELGVRDLDGFDVGALQRLDRVLGDLLALTAP